MFSPNKAPQIFQIAFDHIANNIFALLFENFKFPFFFPNSLAQEQLGRNSSKNKHVPCDAARLKYLPLAGQIFTPRRQSLVKP